MPPKASKSSNKTEKKIQAKIIEDKTFGLKNKNKSKTVQKFISTVTKTVQSRDREALAAAEARQAANAAKEEKKAADAALNQLFSNALVAPVKKKKFVVGTEEAEVLPGEPANVVDPILAALAANSTKEDMDLLEGAEYNIVEFSHEPLNSRHQIASSATDVDYTINNDDSDMYEIKKDKTLEDLIEEQFQEDGTTGTPITAASLAEYNRRKIEAKRIENEAKLKTEMSKKAGGKGLSILTGKELFELSAARFEDDDNAMNTAEVVTSRQVQRNEEEALQASQAERNRGAAGGGDDDDDDLRFQEAGGVTVGGIEVDGGLFDDDDDDDNINDNDDDQHNDNGDDDIQDEINDDAQAKDDDCSS